MSDYFVICGGRPLSGRVRVAGNKNAALPMMVAALLTDEPVTLRNVPRIGDVDSMLQLLQDLGVRVVANGGDTITLQAASLQTRRLSPDLCRQIRASILLAGPMLGRLGQVELPPPGGDVIGRRRIDTHLLAFRALGAQVNMNVASHQISIQADGLKGVICCWTRPVSPLPKTR